jgi:RNA polymerase-binding transcription factor DksA
MKCLSCAKEIPAERLAIIKTDYCVNCAEKKVKKKEADILQSSSTGRNGFAGAS